MPSLGMLTINALAAADSVVIPTQPHYLSAKGLELLLRSVSKVKRQINPHLRIDGILMTMVMPRTNISKEITATVKSAYGQRIKVSDLSGNMYGSIGISNIVAIYAKSPRLGCFPSSSIAWRCRGVISSVSANFSRVIFWDSRKVLMSSPIGVKSNPYLFFLFFSIFICPPPILKFVMFHFTEIEVLIKRDTISIYRNYKFCIRDGAVNK